MAEICRRRKTVDEGCVKKYHAAGFLETWKKMPCLFSIKTKEETYGSYVWKYHRGAYTSRRIRSLREAMKFFNALPEPYVLDYLSRDYDTVSFEQKHLQENPLGLTEYINRCFKE
jgi:hypothetical protein